MTSFDREGGIESEVFDEVEGAAEVAIGGIRVIREVPYAGTEAAETIVVIAEPIDIISQGI